jgi:hypothetical protein
MKTAWGLDKYRNSERGGAMADGETSANGEIGNSLVH